MNQGLHTAADSAAGAATHRLQAAVQGQEILRCGDRRLAIRQAQRCGDLRRKQDLHTVRLAVVKTQRGQSIELRAQCGEMRSKVAVQRDAVAHVVEVIDGNAMAAQHGGLDHLPTGCRGALGIDSAARRVFQFRINFDLPFQAGQRMAGGPWRDAQWPLLRVGRHVGSDQKCPTLSAGLAQARPVATLDRMLVGHRGHPADPRGRMRLADGVSDRSRRLQNRLAGEVEPRLSPRMRIAPVQHRRQHLLARHFLTDHFGKTLQVGRAKATAPTGHRAVIVQAPVVLHPDRQRLHFAGQFGKAPRQPCLPFRTKRTGRERMLQPGFANHASKVLPVPWLASTGHGISRAPRVDAQPDVLLRQAVAHPAGQRDPIRPFPPGRVTRAQLLGLQQKHDLIDASLSAKAHELLKSLLGVPKGIDKKAQNVAIVSSGLIKFLRHGNTPCGNESGNPQQAFLPKMSS